MFIAEGRFLLSGASPYREVSLQMVGSIIQQKDPLNLSLNARVQTSLLNAFCEWVLINDYCTLQLSNIIKQSNSTTCLAQRAQHTRLCPEHRPSVQIPTRLPRPATETNPEQKIFNFHVSNRNKYLNVSCSAVQTFLLILCFCSTLDTGCHYCIQPLSKTPCPESQHLAPQILMDRLYVFGCGGPRPRPAAATSRPAD